MDNDHIVNDVSAFIRDVSSIRHSQEAINDLYSRFVQVHENEMSSKLQRLKTSPKKSQSKKRNPPFWDDKIKQLYKEVSKAEKDFCNCKGDINLKRNLRKIYFEKQNVFDKTFRQLKREYVPKKEINIENMVGKNGCEMWREIEKIGPFVPRPKIPEEVNVNGNYVKKDTSVVLDKWSSEFMKLYRGIEYSDPDYDVNFLQQAISGVAFERPSIDRESNEILNNPIAESEVQKHALKTKTGKAVSVNCIPNEVLKNNMSIKMMTSMFNVFYNLGMIPLTWTQSILYLIYKGGQKDKREPLSAYITY